MIKLIFIAWVFFIIGVSFGSYWEADRKEEIKKRECIKMMRKER